jgi:AraC-like DNA-binding protein
MKPLKTGHSNPAMGTSTLWFRYLLDAIERTHIDSNAMAACVGLDIKRLENPEAYIEDEFTALLLIAASQKTDDPAYGLTAGHYFVPSAFGPLGYSMMTSETLQDALQRTVHYTASVTATTKTRLHSGNTQGFLEILMPSYHPAVARLVDEFMMTAIITAFRWLLGHDFAPLSVEFMHPEPDSAVKYIQTFGVKPVFSSNRCGFLFSRQQLDSRIIFADAAMGDIHDKYAASRLAPATITLLIPQIRRIISQHLHDGEPTLALVAQQLHISERTLQRRLKQEHGSFHVILDEVRKELLKLYLSDTDIPLKDVAHRLGFADQSSFTRAVQRWHGQPPKSLRLFLSHQA